MAVPDPGADRAAEHAADRAGLWVVMLVIGMLLVWAATADLLGGLVGFTTAVGVGTVLACLGWRDRITYELVSNIGLVGIPLLIVGLTIT